MRVRACGRVCMWACVGVPSCFVSAVPTHSQVIMQTNSIKGNAITPVEAVKELAADMTKFGLQGVFRGQAIGIAKAIVSLTLFHEGRIFIAAQFRENNKSQGVIP